MKKLFLLLIAICFFSCTSHKIFYTYEDAETNTYAVLEMSKKYPMINYKYVSDANPNKYIYITGRKNLLAKDDIGIPVFLDLLIIDAKNNIIPCGDLDGGQALIYSSNKKEKIILNKEKIEKIKCFNEYNISWFPPYMILVKKVDYTKFSKNIREVIIAIDKNKSDEKIQALLNKQS